MPGQPVAPAADTLRVVLLVDESRVQRRILKALLAKWGYQVAEASSAAEALEYCASNTVDFIISGWIMPGMSGLEFCKKFREMPRESYGYFILLTSKSETNEVVSGLEVGADDFLTKPVNASELRARLSAGERVLHMEQELNEKNELIRDALEKLQRHHDIIDRDLMQARKIQEALVPERHRKYGESQLSMLLKPCGHVGGDLVGMFSPSENQLGFYSIDVSGHGITSAMMTARLAGYLNARFPEQNIALKHRFEKFYALRQPDEVARILNDRLLSDTGVEEYFTMIFGVADLNSGRLRLVQAGHPHPVIQRSDGEIEFIGTGGLPIGLVADADYDSFEVQLNPGDRLLLYSDGFTEAVCADGEMLEEDGLARMLKRSHQLTGPDVLDDLFWQLTQRQAGAALDDDVSAVMLEYR
ncbi:response regulator [Actibacterium atlanticum]|uniref:Response regulator n=1 Tax=Actibacterium atlanticum TaxID=1461693 RepID=A0A058ZMQ7_9RHOB|nr:SpoIIE family protein phosphatase [Actibacterium atlanticum]KCV82515.1 response regulator [Actibacterium atlanticum]